MLRKILFQIHLWTGLGVGLYVVAICVSGSVLVFRNEFYNYFRPGTTVVPRETERLTDERAEGRGEAALSGLRGHDRAAAQRRSRTAPAEVWLKKDETELHRLFDPYDGRGPRRRRAARHESSRRSPSFTTTCSATARAAMVNGVGGVVLAIMCLTGLVIWWPGIKDLRRGLLVRWKTNWKRFNWDLHSVMGFWTFAFVFMWAITSVYMMFPDPFLDVVDYLQPPSDDVPLRSGDVVLEWFARVHIGRFAGCGSRSCGVSSDSCRRCCSSPA